MSETQLTASALFRAGKLAAAIDAANAAVRNDPRDLGGRVLLAELLLFAGNLERADNILDAASQIDPAAMVGAAEFRQLIRAALARRQHHREGRLPEFLDEPTPALRSAVAAIVAFRADDKEHAAARVAEIEATRPRAPGRAAELQFDDFRDADDLHAGFFEVLTTTGKYYWIPTERVASIDFHPPRRPRDLVWRRAAVSVLDGPDGEVYLPAIYDSDQSNLSDDLLLGRATDWVDPEDAIVRGIGRRVYLAGDDAISIMELTGLRFGT
jgi:type VI secretion system protein ImpE